jgi:uncharacterized repeat protein (TIGR01451 family)
MIRPVFASLLLVLALAACGGSDGSTSAGSNADLAVTSSSPDEVYAGDTVTFTVAVTNEGPAAASNVALTFQLEGGPAIGGMTCTAAGGATCPATLGESMSVASLPAGGGLVFLISVPGSADFIGAVTGTMTASAAADTDLTNNTGASTTIAMDLRNGDYTVYASNGRPYTLSLDFNAMTYQMVGAQLNVAGTLSPDADGIGYIFGSTGTGTARFRMATDLVVGGFEFLLSDSDHVYDEGVRPFVASRRFRTDIAALAGTSFNLMGLNLRRNDIIESVVQPSTIGASVLQVCKAPVPVRVDQCPTDLLASYALTVVGSDIRGFDNVSQDVIRFRLAQSGVSTILLRAEEAADNTGRHFRVGLPETTGLAGGSFATSSTRAAWGTMTVTDTSYAFNGTTTAGDAIAETAVLTPLSGVAPTGMRRGTRSTDGAAIFVAQNDPLVLTLGEAKSLAQGQMDIGLR